MMPTVLGAPGTTRVEPGAKVTEKALLIQDRSGLVKGIGAEKAQWLATVVMVVLDAGSLIPTTGGPLVVLMQTTTVPTRKPGPGEGGLGTKREGCHQWNSQGGTNTSTQGAIDEVGPERVTGT